MKEGKALVRWTQGLGGYRIVGVDGRGGQDL